MVGTGNHGYSLELAKKYSNAWNILRMSNQTNPNGNCSAPGTSSSGDEPEARFDVCMSWALRL